MHFGLIGFYVDQLVFMPYSDWCMHILGLWINRFF